MANKQCIPSLREGPGLDSLLQQFRSHVRAIAERQLKVTDVGSAERLTQTIITEAPFGNASKVNRHLWVYSS
jgi:hypothetical protein